MASQAEANWSSGAAGSQSGTGWTFVLRVFAWYVAGAAIVFLINNYLIFWRDWPGLATFFAYQGWLGSEGAGGGMDPSLAPLGWLQTLSYPAVILLAAIHVSRSKQEGLRPDSERLTALAAYIARAAFWSVLLIGMVDMLLSFLRVEGLMEGILGASLTTEMGRSQFRGTYVHFPLIGLALVLALFLRGIGVAWLAMLVVVAELQIVVLRFIFSYEQAFMGDLVRFWYAALFLFASANTLILDGHVRVDVLFARFSPQKKGTINALGALFLGIPLCVVILTRGMWAKTNIINSPLLSFEVSQSGFGMYTKYLMAGFLAIFALTMIIQFASYFLAGLADRRDEPGRREVESQELGH
jgi:TRAP-type mannitol/chloroaromatic compound transport system permease small subunit